VGGVKSGFGAGFVLLKGAEVGSVWMAQNQTSWREGSLIYEEVSTTPVDKFTEAFPSKHLRNPFLKIEGGGETP